MILLTACSNDDGVTPVEGTEPPRELPNVVIITIDTLRADHLPFYGYSKDTAPFLHQLSENSAVFRKAFSTSSWTAPATASLFTGLYPTRHGLTQGFFAQKKEEEDVQHDGQAKIELTAIRKAVPTLGELLSEQGYTAFGAATNINLDRRLGFQRGFDRDKFFHVNHADAKQVEEQVMSWREPIQSAEPYLLYLHFMDTHEPYPAHAPWYQESSDADQDSLSRYHSGLAYLDQTLERMYEALGWDENTILWIVSDHGEEFRDHGQLGHKFKLYQELLGVLMMCHAPDLGIQPGVHAQNTSLVDVLPTLRESLRMASDPMSDGTSLWPLMTGHEDTESQTTVLDKRFLFAHRERRGDADEVIAAMVVGNWKLIRNQENNSTELYRLDLDPTEQNNLAAQNPKLVAVLSKKIDSMPVSDAEMINVNLDAELLAELEGLGYTED